MFYSPYYFPGYGSGEYAPGHCARNNIPARPNPHAYCRSQRVTPRSYPPAFWGAPEPFYAPDDEVPEDVAYDRGYVYTSPEEVYSEPHHYYHHHHNRRHPHDRRGHDRRSAHAGCMSPRAVPPVVEPAPTPEYFVSYDYVDHPKRRGIDFFRSDADEYREYVRRKVEEQERERAAQRAEEIRLYQEKKAFKAAEKQRRAEEKREAAEQRRQQRAERKPRKAEERQLAKEQAELHALELAAREEWIRQAKQAHFLLLEKQRAEEDLRREALARQRQHEESERTARHAREHHAKERRMKELSEDKRRILLLQLFGADPAAQEEREEYDRRQRLLEQQREHERLERERRDFESRKNEERHKKARAAHEQQRKQAEAAQRAAIEEQVRQSAKLAARVHYAEFLKQQQKMQNQQAARGRQSSSSSSSSSRSSRGDSPATAVSPEEAKRLQAKIESDARQRLLEAARKHAEEEAAELRAREEAENAAALASKDTTQVESREDVPDKFWKQFSEQLSELTSSDDGSISENDIITVTIPDRGRVKCFYVPASKASELLRAIPEKSAAPSDVDVMEDEGPTPSPETSETSETSAVPVSEASENSEDSNLPQSRSVEDIPSLSSDNDEPEVEEPSDSESDSTSFRNGEEWSEIEREDTGSVSAANSIKDEGIMDPPRPSSPTSSIRHVTLEDVEDSDASSDLS